MSFNENLIQFIWQFSLFDFSKLQSLDGESVQILTPGILNSSSGPDFENAKIQIGKTTFYGSVEIHITGQEWFKHKHQENPNYNNVILHVCYEKGADALRNDGTTIPCIEIKHHIKKNTLSVYQNLMESKLEIPCEQLLAKVKPLKIASCIERSGVERLEERGSYIQYCLEKSKNNWNQVAYTMVCRSFGMPQNTAVFEELSWLLPWEFIQKFRDSGFQIEALLFGTLQLNHGEDSYAKSLQNEYEFLAAKWKLKSVSNLIKTGKMRPLASPYIKVAQLAALLSQFGSLIEPPTIFNQQQITYKLSEVKMSAYWNNHYRFGKESKKRNGSLSQSSQKHLVINFLTPFLFHYHRHKNPIVGFDPITLLSQFSPESNNTTRKMKALGFSNNNAFESQALLHLYKQKCKKQLCLSCIIGKELLLHK